MVKNLRKLRLSRGISQQQLADVLGTSQQSVNKYENHSVEPDISALIKLADFFETTIDYLVGHISLPEQDIKEEMELTKEETKLILEYRLHFNVPADGACAPAHFPCNLRRVS